MSRLRAGAVAVAVAVVVVACAGDDGGDDATEGRLELRPSTTVAVDDLYDPPSPLPGSEPGELIAAEAVAVPDGAPAAARAWRILYRSTGVDGSPVGVTGTVVAPPSSAAAGPGRRPVLTWAHGTTGIADVCAPSRRGGSLPWLAELLARDFVVVATDYEGLGTPGVHPYLVGDSEGRSVLDAARAVTGLEGAGAPTGGPVVVAGHSQGGHAALFAAALAPRYAPDLAVVGAVAVAPPTELTELAEPFAGNPVLGGFLATLATGYVAAYPELAIDDVMTPTGVELAEAVHEECLGDVVARAAAVGERLVVDDPLSVAAWRRRVQENVPPAPPEDVPVLVVQGDADPLIPVGVTERFAQRACGAGSVVQLSVYGGADHGSVLAAAQDDVLVWIAGRLRGEAAPVTCA